jgi:hypothetical protein
LINNLRTHLSFQLIDVGPLVPSAMSIKIDPDSSPPKGEKKISETIDVVGTPGTPIVSKVVMVIQIGFCAFTQ